jgi:hypothetical protein
VANEALLSQGALPQALSRFHREIVDRGWFSSICLAIKPSASAVTAAATDNSIAKKIGYQNWQK